MSRYLPFDKLKKPLQKILVHELASKRLVGQSVQGLDIDLYRLGTGRLKILAWSQIHGNESAATKALLRLTDSLTTEKNKDLLGQVSFYFIPQLNPDGSNAYSRYNSLGVDLNRDALKLSQPESLALKGGFDAVRPELCLNLHDQRTVYAAGRAGKPATMSFLAPNVDEALTLSPAYHQTAQLIASLRDYLSKKIPQGIGRFDDSYNPNCFGEYFMSRGVPTILFEAGHYPNDYQRNQVEDIFYLALEKTLKTFVHQTHLNYKLDDYNKIPVNQPEFVDLIIRNVALEVDGQILPDQDIAVMFFEKLVLDNVRFLPLVVNYGQRSDWQVLHPFFNFKNQPDWRTHHTITLNQPASLPYQTDITSHYNFIKDSSLLDLIHQEVPSLVFDTGEF